MKNDGENENRSRSTGNSQNEQKDEIMDDFSLDFYLKKSGIEEEKIEDFKRYLKSLIEKLGRQPSKLVLNKTLSKILNDTDSNSEKFLEKRCAILRRIERRQKEINKIENKIKHIKGYIYSDKFIKLRKNDKLINEFCSKGKERSTIRQYKSVLLSFSNYFNNKNFQLIDKDDIIVWLRGLKGNNLTINTKIFKFKVISSFFNYFWELQKQGRDDLYFLVNPVENIQPDFGERKLRDSKDKKEV
ncbi:MAG: hypothetical protein GF329_01400 [Candidatus Lokiarchaeota archaeon]|nr:hypothetical protein [Candidatus Lokiarchaeota archaeon]